MKESIRYNHYLILLICLLVLGPVELSAQSEDDTDVANELQWRTQFDLSYKMAKNLKLELIPELRFDENFIIDRYQIETQISFRPIKYVWLGASYRFIGNNRENKPTEYLNRYSLNATLKKDFKRWSPSFRLKYTDFTEEVQQGNFLRYKAKLGYDFKNFKLSPHIAAEAFQELSNNEFYKMRYSLGAKYKVLKNNYLQLEYKLDYYLADLRNKHIVALSYKLKF